MPKKMWQLPPESSNWQRYLSYVIFTIELFTLFLISDLYHYSLTLKYLLIEPFTPDQFDAFEECCKGNWDVKCASIRIDCRENVDQGMLDKYYFIQLTIWYSVNKSNLILNKNAFKLKNSSNQVAARQMSLFA